MTRKRENGPDNTEVRELPIALTDDEVRVRGKELAKVESEYRLAEDAKKADAAHHKDVLTEIEERRGKLAEAINSGKELRRTECAWRRNDDRKTMELLRLDTSEIVESRGMTDAELQEKLALIEDHRGRRRADIDD